MYWDEFGRAGQSQSIHHGLSPSCPEGLKKKIKAVNRLTALAILFLDEHQIVGEDSSLILEKVVMPCSI